VVKTHPRAVVSSRPSGELVVVPLAPVSDAKLLVVMIACNGSVNLPSLNRIPVLNRHVNLVATTKMGPVAIDVVGKRRAWRIRRNGPRRSDRKAWTELERTVVLGFCAANGRLVVRVRIVGPSRGATRAEPFHGLVGFVLVHVSVPSVDELLGVGAQPVRTLFVRVHVDSTRSRPCTGSGGRLRVQPGVRRVVSAETRVLRQVK
jgi:hypothetical protein